MRTIIVVSLIALFLALSPAFTACKVGRGRILGNRRAGCHGTGVVMQAAPAAACSSTQAACSSAATACSSGVLMRHSTFAERRADRMHNRADRIQSRRGSVVLVAPACAASPPAADPKTEKIPAPKK